MGAIEAPSGTKAYGPQSKATKAIEAVIGAPYGAPTGRMGSLWEPLGLPLAPKPMGPNAKPPKPSRPLSGLPVGPLLV